MSKGGNLKIYHSQLVVSSKNANFPFQRETESCNFCFRAENESWLSISTGRRQSVSGKCSVAQCSTAAIDMGALANKHLPAGRVEKKSAGWQFRALHGHSMAIKSKLIAIT